MTEQEWERERKMYARLYAQRRRNRPVYPWDWFFSLCGACEDAARWICAKIYARWKK